MLDTSHSRITIVTPWSPVLGMCFGLYPSSFLLNYVLFQSLSIFTSGIPPSAFLWNPILFHSEHMSLPPQFFIFTSALLLLHLVLKNTYLVHCLIKKFSKFFKAAIVKCILFICFSYNSATAFSSIMENWNHITVV